MDKLNEAKVFFEVDSLGAYASTLAYYASILENFVARIRLFSRNFVSNFCAAREQVRVSEGIYFPKKTRRSVIFTRNDIY